ncbi:MAG: GNAT family N-acetyltransferase [Lachnospiraceae bacterium]|nr:GNAT family N-acetyltransferase [Lachnospiraceae bacterium]
MKIRKLRKNELPEAYLISAYCFHVRTDDTDAEIRKIDASNRGDWGAFDDDGTLMARIINNHYTFYLDGHEIPVGGVGAVSTLPEYRDRGAIREIFKKLLKDAYKNGEVLSALFPFKHEFYRKSGYETITHRNRYTFAPAVLSGYHFDGEVKKWNTGDPVTEFLSVYSGFARGFNLAAVRTEEMMREHMKVDKPFADRKFSYLFEQGGKPVAYLIFTDIRHDPAAILEVEECAWTCRDGFNAILGFLARFEADYGEISLPLPLGIDLLRIIRSPLSYHVEKKTGQNFMARVINTEKLLEMIRKPAGCDLVIKVTDEIIKENNRTFRVRDSKVIETKAAADIELSERALSQMAVGAVNLDEAMLREDVTVRAKEEMLRMLFREKNIFVGEHF